MSDDNPAGAPLAHSSPDVGHMGPSVDPAAQLATHIATELRAIIIQLRRRMRAQADTGDLTPSQSSALVRLEREGPMTLSALGRAEGVRPQSMAATVGALLTQGHVVSAPDPDDRRQSLLSLTDACRAWLLATRAARQDWLTRVIGRDLDPAEQQQLAEALLLLRRVANA